MPKLSQIPSESVLNHLKNDFPKLLSSLTVGEALSQIHMTPISDKIVYFYVLDERGILIGVVPIRSLLSNPPDRFLIDIMIRNVITIPSSATLLEASQFFVDHKYLAFPVVDTNNIMLGVIDLTLFATEMVDITRRREVDEVFETIGFRVASVNDKSAFMAFRYRFPWLLPTILTGSLCAILAGAFETTLAENLVITFFLTLMLGLGESVSIQSLTITIKSLSKKPPELKWFFSALTKEFVTSLLLGIACALIVFTLVILWKHDFSAAMVISSSIILSLLIACSLGLAIPTLIHAMKLDPKIAAGPLTLAITDLCTLLFYFGLAKLFLTHH